jgi:hypothetical protein
MKLTRTRLLSKILVAASALGVAQAANAACTQQAITERQSFLRLNPGDDICATNAGSIQASGGQSAGVQILGPGQGSATLVLTNTSSVEVLVGSGTDVGISVDLNRGLIATIVNRGDIGVNSSNPSTEPIGIQVTDGYMNGNPLVLQNQGAIGVDVAGSGTGIFLNNTVATVTNDGDIFVDGAINASNYNLYGIQAKSYDKLTPTSLISNRGYMSVRAGSTDFQSGDITGIYSVGGSVANSGTLLVIGNQLQTAQGMMVSNGNGGTINNSGGLSVQVANSTLAAGITFSGDLAEIQNAGTIKIDFTSDARGALGTVAGIYSDSNFGRAQAGRIVNTNTITAVSQSNLFVLVYGISVQGGDVSNSGKITASAVAGRSYGIQNVVYAGGGSINNSGTINALITGTSVFDNVAVGLGLTNELSSPVSAVNSGTIIATTAKATNASDQAIGVLLTGDNITFTNSGTIKAEGSTARAIEVVSTNTVVELTKSSVIVGDIYTNQQGNILRHNVGAAQHYVLQTTGDWILEDLDGSAVGKGSAMAAGVGRAETADEMLFERTQLFLQSMDRGQMRRDLTGDSALWVDPYAYDSKRSASSSDPTVVKYGSNGFGLTLGYDFRAFGLKAQVIGNIQSGRLNIDDNTQDVDSTSWLVGLRLPSFYEVGSVSFSAMAFAGRNQYSSDSQVLTNTTSTGTDMYSSGFGSTQLLFGLGAKYATPLTQSTDLSLTADLYLSQEYIEGYQEGPYFSWNSRTLTQGSAFLEAGIDHRLTDQWLVQAKVGANAQTLFSGQTTNYSINNTPVSFSGGQTNDTGLYAMLGTQYQVKDNASVGISVWYGQTTNSVKTIQGMVEAKFLF